MLKIRLQRRGKKNFATYRVVVAEQRAPIKGRYVADIGWYNPHTSDFNVKADDAKKWIEQGAQPSPTVNNLMIEKGIIKGDKLTSWAPKKKLAEGESASGGKKGEDPEKSADADNGAGKPAEEKGEKEEKKDKSSEDTVEKEA